MLMNHDIGKILHTFQLTIKLYSSLKGKIAHVNTCQTLSRCLSSLSHILHANAIFLSHKPYSTSKMIIKDLSLSKLDNAHRIFLLFPRMHFLYFPKIQMLLVDATKERSKKLSYNSPYTLIELPHLKGIDLGHLGKQQKIKVIW